MRTAQLLQGFVDVARQLRHPRRMELRDAVVWLTGASDGIGHALVEPLVNAGAKVVVTARRKDPLAALQERFGPERVAAVPGDLMDQAGLEDLHTRACQSFGPIDVLINNAGIEVSSLLEDMTSEQINQLITVNLLAPIQLTHQALPKMVERGKGSLVFTSSVAAAGGNPMLSTYSASKAGLTRFAESVRMELTHDDIDVTILHLGPVETEMWDRIDDGGDDHVLQRRAEKLGVLSVASVDEVSRAAVRAVRAGNREVRLPKRMAIAPALNVLGTRTNELVYRGIDVRGAQGKRS